MSGVPQPIRHGTPGGYVTHKRRGEDACNECLTAWRIYYQRRNGAVSRRIWALRRIEAATKAAIKADRQARFYAARKPRRNAKRAADRAAKAAALAPERSGTEETP